jgi:hypothetical protein
MTLDPTLQQPVPSAANIVTRFRLTELSGGQVIDWVVLKDNFAALGSYAAHLGNTSATSPDPGDNTFLGTQTAAGYVISPLAIEGGTPDHVIGLSTGTPGRLRAWPLSALIAGGSVPTGGTTGQVLAKTSNTNFATGWVTINGIPSGGTTGQVLAKTSGTDYAASWQSIVIPSGGTGGQVLEKASGTNYDLRWATPSGTGLSWPLAAPAGSAGAPSYNFSTTTNTGIYSPGAGRLAFSAGGTCRWEINTGGHFITCTDNTYDIGTTSPAARPRDIFAARNIAANGTISAQTTLSSAGNITAGTTLSVVSGATVGSLNSGGDITGNALIVRGGYILFGSPEVARIHYRSDMSGGVLYVPGAFRVDGNIYPSAAITWAQGAPSLGRSNDTLTVTTHMSVFWDLTVGNHIEARDFITTPSRAAAKANQLVLTDANALGRVRDARLRGITWDEPAHPTEDAMHRPFSEPELQNPQRHVGFTAEEMAQVVPEVVATDSNGPAGIAYGNLTAVLWGAVRELAAQVEDLQKKAAF